MPLDPARILGQPPIVTRQTLTRRDTILYALGVGAEELAFTFEDVLQSLPTMPVVLGYPGFFWRDPKYGVDWRRLLHAEQSIEIHAALPVEGEIVGETRIEALVDKGADKGAIAYVTRSVVDGSGRRIATLRTSTFLRGEGGFGGTGTAATAPHAVPTDRPADQVVTFATASNQAAIYRLSGDYNPLHIDPAVAHESGFARPILHGLCTLGVVGRALLSGLCDGDPTRLKRMDVRFSAPVYPGETIRTELWREGDGTAGFIAKVVERDLIVLSNGYAQYH